MVEHFTWEEAKALYRADLYSTQDLKDEFDRILIPQGSVVDVIGIDVWPAHTGEDAPIIAMLAVQFDAGPDSESLPKVVMIRKDMYQQYFEEITL